MKNQQLTDTGIVARIQQGDEQAFEALFEKYYQPLCRFAFSFLNSYEMSEELVTDVFVSLWKNAANVQIKTSIKVYLFSSVKYQCFAQLKRNIRMTELSRAEEISPKLIELSTPLDSLLFLELTTIFNIAIQSLPAQCKLIYHMHFTENLSYKEIADVLNISTKTVENHLGRAIKTIRRALKQAETSKV